MITSCAKDQRAFFDPASVQEHSSPDRAALPETETIRRAQLGDADAFERIYKLHSRRVYALCLRMAAGNPAEAEDLTQEAFLTVLRKIKSFRGDSAFSTWLHRIAVNLVLMRLRKRPLQQASPERTGEQNEDRGGPNAELGGPDLRLAGSIDRVTLERAMQQLAPCHRLVFVLHDVQGYKHKEIAKILSWSIGNSKAQLHRSRRKLRELLREGLGLGCAAQAPRRETTARPSASAWLRASYE
jgi:RNA polymerase sigma-70 factor (ECF subfamily)